MAFSTSASSSSSSSSSSTTSDGNSVAPTTLHSLHHYIQVKLSRKNYLIWYTQIVSYLEGNKLYEFVNGESICPTKVKIPEQLANGLIFLSALDLSFNQLVGQIPFIKQFATFSESSFKGNDGLCGFPLKSQCTNEEPQLPAPTHEEKHWEFGIVIEWNYISAELGFIFGIGIVIGPLMFCKKWRIWYYKHVEDILFKIFPQLYLGKEHHRRQAFRNQESRH